MEKRLDNKELSKKLVDNFSKKFDKSLEERAKKAESYIVNLQYRVPIKFFEELLIKKP